MSVVLQRNLNLTSKGYYFLCGRRTKNSNSRSLNTRLTQGLSNYHTRINDSINILRHLRVLSAIMIHKGACHDNPICNAFFAFIHPFNNTRSTHEKSVFRSSAARIPFTQIYECILSTHDCVSCIALSVSSSSVSFE